VLERSARCRDEPVTLWSAKDIGDTLRSASSEIDHATTRRMPQRMIGPLDVDVVFKGNVRAVHLEHVDLGRRVHRRVG